MKFVKMEGCGNDYVYVNGITEIVEDKPAVVRRLSDRHFGIGGDGVIFINDSKIADFEMEMYNADGSRSEMCGNGIRCVAKFVYDFGLTDKTELKIESAGKIKYISLFLKDGKVERVKVDMGEPELNPAKIPVCFEKETMVDEEVTVDGTNYRITCVSMGNPHAVTFVENTDNLDLEKIGPFFENHEIFPNRTNTEFVEIVDRKTVKMRVWERGTGETLACGTGCCATVVACVLNGLTEENVTVKVLGGEIEIFYDREQNKVFMTGPATTVFCGEVEL